MSYICCVGFASLDVVCDELNDCAWNVMSNNPICSVAMNNGKTPHPIGLKVQ